MNLQELYEIVHHQMRLCEKSHRTPEDIRICIPIETVNAYGGTPCVDIRDAHKGFDWDDNKFILYPDSKLSLADHDHLAKMRKEAEDMGWTAYEVKNLKHEIKQLKKLLNGK